MKDECVIEALKFWPCYNFLWMSHQMKFYKFINWGYNVNYVDSGPHPD